MASYFTHGIFDPLSCTGTQWIVDKVMLEHSLHSVLICDIPTVRFQLDCSRAAVCPCTVFRVRCRPHSEGCAKDLAEDNLGFLQGHLKLSWREQFSYLGEPWAPSEKT